MKRNQTGARLSGRKAASELPAPFVLNSGSTFQKVEQMKTEETGIERAVRFAKEPADAVKEFEAELKRFKQLFSVTPSGAIGWNLVCGDETSPATHAWFVANEMKLFWRAIRLAGPESVLFEVVDLEALDLLSDWVYETSKRPPELSPSRPDDSPNTVFTSPEDAQRISEGNSRAVGLFRRLQRSLREFSDAVSFKELLNDPRNDSARGVVDETHVDATTLAAFFHVDSKVIKKAFLALECRPVVEGQGRKPHQWRYCDAVKALRSHDAGSLKDRALLLPDTAREL